MDEILSITFWGILIFSAIRLATPMIFAALGGMFSERSGVINIALEGLMLAGAFTAAVVTYELSNPYFGFLCGMVAGGLLAFVFAVVVIRFEADQVVAGFGVNILMLGVPALLSGAIYDSAGSTEQIAKEYLLPEIFRLNIASILAFAMVPFCWYVLYKTPFGLRIRAVGENPEAADAAGRWSISGNRPIFLLYARDDGG
jgi:simple sugar transport system permease protein